MRGIFDNYLNTNLIIKNLSTVQCTALTFWHGFYRYPERKYEWMNETQNYKLSDQNDDKMKSEKSESGSQSQKLDKQVTSSVSSSSSSSVLVWCYARVPVSCISAFCFNTSVLRLQHLQSLQLRISHTQVSVPQLLSLLHLCMLAQVIVKLKSVEFINCK